METQKVYVLTEEDIERLIEKAAIVAASTATEAVIRSKNKEEKMKIDRRLHNTKLLLRNYRALKDSCEEAVYDKTSASPGSIISELMEMRDDSVIVDSIRRSAERTAIILAHIDKMLDVYRVYCSKYTEKEKRQYKVIKATYISKQKTSVYELSQKYGVSKVTIYDDLKAGEERLAGLIFGIDGLMISKK